MTELKFLSSPQCISQITLPMVAMFLNDHILYSSSFSLWFSELEPNPPRLLLLPCKSSACQQTPPSPLCGWYCSFLSASSAAYWDWATVQTLPDALFSVQISWQFKEFWGDKRSSSGCKLCQVLTKRGMTLLWKGRLLLCMWLFSRSWKHLSDTGHARSFNADTIWSVLW